MAKALRTYPEPQRKEIALRRLASQTKGLGYFAAQDYLNRKAK